jgi:hypothetical protein
MDVNSSIVPSFCSITKSITNTMSKNKIANRIRSIIGISAFYTTLLFLSESYPLPFFFVQSQEQTTITQNRNELPTRKLKKTVKKGDWVITEEIDKNNFVLDFVPEGPTIIVTDYDPDDDIRVNMMYNGSIYLNAWISDADFDVAPRYVESYTGIKYASTYMRFDRSEQAYGYNYVNYNISEEDGKTREIFVNATKFGPMCIQDGVDERFMNEDCLYLNIWRPSRWKESLNTTSRCKQKFMGGGVFRKDCEIITTTRTIKADGSIVIKTNKEKTSKTIPMGGLYDKDGSLFDGDTDILNNKELNDDIKKQGSSSNMGVRDLEGLSDTLDDLNEALNDLNEIIEEDTNDSEDVSNPNNVTKEPSTLGTYNTDSSGLLPVMVYIHGGGFMEGSGNDRLFDGSKAAGRGQVIIITLNYRLGIFGFLPSFGWDQWKVNGGMNGFMDIVNALIWINRNIIKFGGNPNKVTVFGPSSTPAVCLLTMCPLAAGKFQRAILQTSIRETEVRNGRMVTKNGVNGASCLLSSQEPYQPLEGRIEVAYKFFDYINDTYYNFPENPDPSREDLVDWLKAFRFNSTELLKVANEEGTVFVPQRPAASFDYNRDENITDTQQRRTFMTWDNDVFPRMPIDLEFINPVDMIVGVRGRRTDDRKPQKRPSKNKNKNSSNDAEETPASLAENPNALVELSANEKRNSDNIFLRNTDNPHRHLEEEELDPNNYDNVTEFDDNNDDDFYVDYDDDQSLADKYNQSICTNSSQYVNETARNATAGNATVECEDYVFDFSGTTNDQDLCVSKQFAEIAARNMEGNVYGYVIDDGTDLHGYQYRDRIRRQLLEAREKLHQEHWDHPKRTRNLQRQIEDFDYDIESLYFFDNIYIGNTKGEDEIITELFNRWINFAKTGVPKVSSRSEVESKKYTIWDPFPKDKIGRDPNDEYYMPSYLYISADSEGIMGKKRSTMVRLDDLVSHRTQQKYPYYKNSDICSWVMDEENDPDGGFVEVLLDFNANTAFEYYVTILATMNPTINYVPDREYLAKLPPTIAPTTIRQFIDTSMENSSSPQSRTGMATGVVSVVMVAGFIAFW